MRIQVRLIAAALVGLVLNTLVAAALWAYKPRVQSSGMERVSSTPLILADTFDAGADVYSWVGSRVGKRIETYGIPIGPPSAPTSATKPLAAVLSVGWPCLSFEGAFSYKTQSCIWAVMEPKSWAIIGLGQREWIPLRPVVVGTLINTAFYGAIAWLLAVGFFRWRSDRRASKGLCRRCAYNLSGGSACPECGLLN